MNEQVPQFLGTVEGAPMRITGESSVVGRSREPEPVLETPCSAIEPEWIEEKLFCSTLTNYEPMGQYTYSMQPKLTRSNKKRFSRVYKKQLTQLL